MGLNMSAPSSTYRRLANAAGMHEFHITDLPLDIINQLRAMYGKLVPTDRMNMENYWSLVWNPQVLFKAYFK